MNELPENTGEEVEKVNLLQEVKDTIGTETMADCFVALCLSTLRQWLLSSDSKYFIFHDMLDILEKKGYSEEQMNSVRLAMQLIVEKYNVKNSFMG